MGLAQSGELGRLLAIHLNCLPFYSTTLTALLLAASFLLTPKNVGMQLEWVKR